MSENTGIGDIGVRTRGLQPPDSGKTITFRTKAKFFGRGPQPKVKKNIFFCIY